MNYTSLTSTSNCFESLYGPAAYSLKHHLEFLYTRIATTEPPLWEVRSWANGLLSLVPIACNKATQNLYDQANHGEIFLKAISRAHEAIAEHDEESEILAVLVAAGKQAEELAKAI